MFMFHTAPIISCQPLSIRESMVETDWNCIASSSPIQIPCRLIAESQSQERPSLSHILILDDPILERGKKKGEVNQGDVHIVVPDELDNYPRIWGQDPVVLFSNALCCSQFNFGGRSAVIVPRE